MKKLLLLPAALLCTAVSSQAALSVTNGGFGTGNTNASTVSGGGWYESGTANWVEGTWSNPGKTAPGGEDDSFILLFDGAGTGYVYQSLGTLDQADIDAGTFKITADFGQKNDDVTNHALFDIYTGSFQGVDGTDIKDGGLTSLGSFNLDATAQGLTEASGDTTRNQQVGVGTFDVSGLSIGDEVWIRIGEEYRNGATQKGDLMIDNVTVTAVPEPSSSALLGLAGLALIFRRRK